MRPKSYFDREVKLHTPEQMFKRLEAITGQPIPQGLTRESPGVLRSPEETASAGGGNFRVSQATASPSRPALQWFAPTRTPEGPQMRSQCGAYVIRKVMKAGAATYQLYKGKTALGPSYSTLDAAQALAQRDADG